MKIKDFRSKIIKTFSFIVVLLLFYTFNYSYAEDAQNEIYLDDNNTIYEVNLNDSDYNEEIEFKILTQEEIGSTISYTDRTSRETLHYTNIYTFEDLYSVFEDLDYDYERALEEIDSLNYEIKENREDYSNKLEEICEELNIDKNDDILESISAIKYRTIQLQKDKNLYFSFSIILLIIGIIMGIIINEQRKK